MLESDRILALPPQRYVLDKDVGCAAAAQGCGEEGGRSRSGRYLPAALLYRRGSESYRAASGRARAQPRGEKDSHSPDRHGVGYVLGGLRADWGEAAPPGACPRPERRR